MWTLWGLPPSFPCCLQEEASTPGNGGEDLSPFGPLYPPASSPTSVSPQAPITLASSEHSYHTHQIQSPLPSAFSWWASIHPSKSGSNITSVKPFLSILCAPYFWLPAMLQGPSHCIAHLFLFPFLNRELPEATASSDPALNPEYSAWRKVSTPKLCAECE